MASIIQEHADVCASQLTFHPFPILPFEIRSSIFHFALQPLPDPNIIHVHVDIDPGSPFDRHEHDSRGSRFPTRSKFARFFNPDASAPPGLKLLWTSNESRVVARSYYSFTCSDTPQAELWMDGENSENRAVPMRVPKFKNPGILFNPNRDIIYFRQSNGIAALSYARSSELNLSNIKVLALDLYLWRHYLIARQLFEGWEEDAPFLTGLQRLIIILESDQSTRFNLDAMNVGNEAAVEKLRVEVQDRLVSLPRLKQGIRVQVLHGNDLASLIQEDSGE